MFSIIITNFDHGTVKTHTYYELFPTVEDAANFLKNTFKAVWVEENEYCGYWKQISRTDYFTIYQIREIYLHDCGPKIMVV